MHRFTTYRQPPDHLQLQAWLFVPDIPNHVAVILLHGLSDNRTGMIGYAELLLAHHFTVLLPDARAHGASGSDLATYSLVERNDIRQWCDWLTHNEHPACIDGFGESMGAAQLLQSLAVEPGFCAVIAESPFSNFREIGYDRAGQFFHTGPWLRGILLRAPPSNLPSGMERREKVQLEAQAGLARSRSRLNENASPVHPRRGGQQHPSSPLRTNRRPVIRAQSSGKSRTPTTAAPSTQRPQNSNPAYSTGTPHLLKSEN